MGTKRKGGSMKKNPWLTPRGITATILMIGAIGTAIVITATYITLPKDVQAMQQDITDLKTIIDYYYRTEQQPQYQANPNQGYRQQAPQYPSAPRQCWDEYYQEWYNCEDY